MATLTILASLMMVTTGMVVDVHPWALAGELEAVEEQALMTEEAQVAETVVDGNHPTHLVDVAMVGAGVTTRTPMIQTRTCPLR